MVKLTIFQKIKNKVFDFEAVLSVEKRSKVSYYSVIQIDSEKKTILQKIPKSVFFRSKSDFRQSAKSDILKIILKY